MPCWWDFQDLHHRQYKHQDYRLLVNLHNGELIFYLFVTLINDLSLVTDAMKFDILFQVMLCYFYTRQVIYLAYMTAEVDKKYCQIYWSLILIFQQVKSVYLILSNISVSVLSAAAMLICAPKLGQGKISIPQKEQIMSSRVPCFSCWGSVITQLRINFFLTTVD